MAEKKLLRVGVLFGGRSGEHEISLRSALTVMSAMDPARYEIVPIGIERDGRWYLENDALKVLAETTPHLAALSAGGHSGHSAAASGQSFAGPTPPLTVRSRR